MKIKQTLPQSIALATVMLWTLATSVSFAQPEPTEQPPPKIEIEIVKFVQTKPTNHLLPIIKAEHGAKMKFAFQHLPNHESLEISFVLHIVGLWDGTRYPKWGPDRMIVSLDDETRLLDATFNNCHLLFIDNVWQTYPDPYHPRQGIGRNYRRMLQFGGTGAERIASLGFAANRKKSVDSTYKFRFFTKHTSSEAELGFLVNWEEDASSSSYWVENLRIKPLTTAPALSEEAEEKAWQTMLSSDAAAAQKSWATIFTAHPDLYLKRVQSLVTTNQTRRKWLIKQLSKGPTPVESLIRPVTLPPTQKNAAETHQRIALLRELALSHDPYSETRRYISPKEYTPSVQAIRAACYANKGLEVRRIKMRVSAYLRMLQSKKALNLLKKFDQPIPATQWSADCEDPAEETTPPDK